jgi:uncharacterized metal-binding protein
LQKYGVKKRYHADFDAEQAEQVIATVVDALASHPPKSE